MELVDAMRKPGKAEMAALGFLGRYSGPTRKTYEATLRVLWRWCGNHNIEVLDVSRSILEMFARYLEDERKNLPATVHHHLCIVRMFYKIAEIDEYIVKSPATHLRLPHVYQDETRTDWLNRMELGAVIQLAKRSHPTNAALIALMGMVGLRVSEACSVKIEDYNHFEQNHRVLKIRGKGGKPATIPLPNSVIRLLDDAAGDRRSGPLLLRKSNGEPMNRKAAAGIVARLCEKAGITRKITPHSFRHSYVTAALDAGVPLRDVQIAARHSDARITARYDRARYNHDRHANHAVSAFLAGVA